MTAALFVAAAATGTFVRWWAWAHRRVRTVATFTVNVLGAFLLGLMADVSADAQLVGGIGGLGAMTTFSTLIAELVELNRHSRARAFAYGSATLVVGVAAAWVGLRLA